MRALALLALASVLTGCPEQLSPAQRGVPPERVPPAEPIRTTPPGLSSQPPAQPPTLQPAPQPPLQPAPQQPTPQPPSQPTPQQPPAR